MSVYQIPEIKLIAEKCRWLHPRQVFFNGKATRPFVVVIEAKSTALSKHVNNNKNRHQ